MKKFKLKLESFSIDVMTTKRKLHSINQFCWISHLDVFCKKAALKNFQIHKKAPLQELFIDQICNAVLQTF